MNRRWFLKALIALPFVPLGAKVAAAIELKSAAPQAHVSPHLADIIAQTIEARQKQIADNAYKNNSLLMALRRCGVTACG